MEPDEIETEKAMSDLKSKTVEELCTVVWTCGGSKAAAYELARRLEEAQQRIVAQQARIDILLDGLDEHWQERQVSEVLKNDFSALDVHSAEVAAKALEEAKTIVLRRGREIGGAIDPNRTAAEIDSKASEYSAKAGRKE